MAKIKGTILVDKERCKGCGVCVASCPCDVLHLSAEVNSKGYPVAQMANPGTKLWRNNFSNCPSNR